MFDWPAYCSISLPTSVEPVKVILSTSSCSASALPLISPGPLTTLKTPSGPPASLNSSASRRQDSGACSAGFSTTVLPAASAGAIFQTAISSG